MINLYEILEISPQSSQTEIKKAYKRKAVQFHPDKNLNNPKAEEMFKAVNTAFQILSDPSKKAEYDFQLQQSQIQQTPPDKHYYTNSTDRRYGQAQERAPQASSYTKAEPYEPPVSKKEIIAFVIGSILFIFFASYSFVQYRNYNVNQNVEKAQLLFDSGDRKGAMKSLDKALRQNDESLSAYVLYAKILDASEKRRRDAIRYASEAQYLSENFLPEMAFVSAKAHIALKQYGKAESEMQKVLELYPESYEGNLLMAEAKLYNPKHSKPQSAIAYANKAIAINPKDSESYLIKGIAERQTARYDSANSSFLKARRRNRGNGVVYHYMGLNELDYYKDTLKACNLFGYARNLGVRESEFYIRKFCKEFYEVAD